MLLIGLPISPEKGYRRSPCGRGSSEIRQERERLTLARPKNLYPRRVMFAGHAGNLRLVSYIAGYRLC